ncbi:low temperature requirement protein A [Embleya sp. MST-111070]|uniref:low temperature requirement protein A n=1 Tax=Embleya sp. MST-111070 TaxID=3398231 RepID=UPI003F7348CA
MSEAVGERRATWFELFCDLVFVAAVGQVVHRVGEQPTGGSVVGAAALFVPVWWTWVLYTVRANRFDPDDSAHRLITMVGMAAVAAMAVFVGGVGHGAGANVGFVAGYLGARGVIVFSYAWGARSDPSFRPILRSFGTMSTLTGSVWVLGLLVPRDSVRYGLWAVAMVGELSLPFLARRRIAAASHDAEHLRERFGLFTIIVIGEAVLGCTGGLADGGRDAVSTGLIGLSAFALCACVWWMYFNASATRVGGHEEIATSPILRDVYVFGHLPIQLGIAVTGAAIGTVVGGDDRHVSTATAACLLGGIVLFLVAGAGVRAAFAGSRDATVWIRIAAAVVVSALLPAAGVLPVAGLIGATAAILVVTAAAEGPATHRRLAESAARG